MEGREAKWEKGEILIPLAAGTKQQSSDGNLHIIRASGMLYE